MQIAIDRSSPKTSGSATRTSGSRPPAPLPVQRRALPPARPPAESTRATLERAFGADVFAAAATGPERAVGNRATQEIPGAPGGSAIQAKAAGPGVEAGSGPGGGVNPTGIPSPVRAKMEAAFGADFSGVRVHPRSSRATALGALAYTQGSEIHVAPGQWAPETRQGQELLGHELAHVVQQREGRVQATAQYKGVALNDAPALEAEADAMGARAARGEASRRDGDGVLAPVLPHLGAPIQCMYTEGRYHIDGKPRSLYCDYHEVVWGRRTNPNDWPTDKRDRAILYETIVIPDNLDGLVQNFSEARADPHDLGLTVMLNSCYKEPNHRPVENDLDRARDRVLRNWNGPPISIGTLAWELGEGERPRDAVPFATLRKEAAASPQATRIKAQLETNHEVVWRKLGDDDMKFVNPNDKANAAMKKLAEAEENEVSATHFVTFGYNLTSHNVPQDGLLGKFLEFIYRSEMNLRDKIAKDYVKTSYPIEPNTFYRLQADAEKKIYERMDDVNLGVGGEGQIKEGLRLLAAARGTVGHSVVQHSVFHTVLEPTAAGKRNNGLIAVLNPLVEAAREGNPPDPDQKTVIDQAIAKMDQSYFGPGVWSRNVEAIAGKAVDRETWTNVELLIEERRNKAADFIFTKLRDEARNQRENQAARAVEEAA